MSKENGGPAFLGREYFDCNTRMWVFRDGTGAVPEEMRQDLYNACEDRNPMGCNGLSVLSTLFAWKRRLAERSKP